jgi:glycosyltransferase involved in cell wall biosynthesis
MAVGKPLVSVGMPIYNEGKFVRESLDSLLAQDYENIEVIITDNTSTDGTEFICREYAARDRRVRYVRNEYNVGAIENFNRAFHLGTGPYFMWASGHDLRSAGSISKCVEVLERNPDVVLCYPEIVHIDREGAPTRRTADFSTAFHHPWDKTGQALSLLWSERPPEIIYGLIHRSALARTRLFRAVWGSDIAILLRLCLEGFFAQVRGEFLYARDPRGPDCVEQGRYKRSWFSDETRPRRWFPFWGFVRECLLAVSGARLPLLKKVGLYAGLLLWLARLKRPLMKEVMGGGG